MSVLLRDQGGHHSATRIYAVLMRKLGARCGALRLLLNCSGLEAVFRGAETLVKRSLQHLSARHGSNVDPEHDVNHVTLSRCRAPNSSLCLSVDDSTRTATPEPTVTLKRISSDLLRKRQSRELMQDRTDRTSRALPSQSRVPPLAGRSACKVTLLGLIGTFRLKADPADRPDSVPYLMRLAFLYPSPLLVS